uniref:Putative secreted protein n=1 Tax=Ixodes ricinus TaxID=34613 RepID=A0A6B0USF0_IXORI
MATGRASFITGFLLWFKKIQLTMSEAILACGGSSSLEEGRRSWFRQDSSRATRAWACCSIVPVSRMAEVALVMHISTTLWMLLLCRKSEALEISRILESTSDRSPTIFWSSTEKRSPARDRSQFSSTWASSSCILA